MKENVKMMLICEWHMEEPISLLRTFAIRQKNAKGDSYKRPTCSLRNAQCARRASELTTKQNNNNI